jgi:hypothetical protein
MKVKRFENSKLNSTDEYIEMTAKEEYILSDVYENFLHIITSIPKGQKIFISNYARFNNNSSEAYNYPYVVHNILPDESYWREHSSWISKKNLLKYFE